jgi:hypothetical protein
MKWTLTGKLLQIEVNADTGMVKYTRFCYSRNRFLNFAFKPVKEFGSVENARQVAREYLRTVEGLTDAQIQEVTKTEGGRFEARKNVPGYHLLNPKPPRKDGPGC